nr:hypothetical protein [Pandoravirus aubagnensis]
MLKNPKIVSILSFEQVWGTREKNTCKQVHATRDRVAVVPLLGKKREAILSKGRQEKTNRARSRHRARANNNDTCKDEAPISKRQRALFFLNRETTTRQDAVLQKKKEDTQGGARGAQTDQAESSDRDARTDYGATDSWHFLAHMRWAETPEGRRTLAAYHQVKPRTPQEEANHVAFAHRIMARYAPPQT